MTDGDWVDLIASKVGAPGPAVRLLVSLLMGYPFAVVHRLFLYGRAPILQHLFFIIAGSYIGYFNYGGSIIHAYICILANYIVLLATRGTKLTVAVSFIFQMGYLLREYLLTETINYDIKWTIPHCVLTLRLIGQAFDVYDGRENFNQLKGDQKHNALTQIPNILESAGHCMYPGSFMIGPQYPLRRYLDFVVGKFSENGRPLPTILPGLKRLLIGLTYIAIYQVANMFINNDFLDGPKFAGLPLYQKLLLTGVFGRVILYKYVSCWIVTEGACIMAGIAYSGKDASGNHQHTGCENINVPLFEKYYKFSHLISSFNKCTNAWVAQNIYKRLRFLNNRYISQFAALMFLAVWHGLHTGYYMCFFLEFIVMWAEKDLEVISSKNQLIARWHASTIGYWIDFVVLKVIVSIFFGYCTLAFSLLSTDKWWRVYGELYFCGHFIFGLWPIYGILIKQLLIPKRSRSDEPKPSTSKAKDQ